MVRMILVAALTLAAPQALACGIMEKADPKVGSTVGEVKNVTLTFSQTVEPGSSHVSITGAQGGKVAVGNVAASQDDSVLSVPVPALAPDTYKVKWDVLWHDCQARTSGTYKFTVGAP